MKKHTHYVFDQFLLYLIQDVTKKPSVEILTFFYELAREVVNMGIEGRKDDHSGIYKKIDNFFPGTSIPFHMLVDGRVYSGWGTNEDRFECSVEIGFPDRGNYMDEKELKKIEEALMEHTLLGGVGVIIPNFTKPEIKVPKMYKSLMAKVIGYPIEEKKSKKKK